MITVCLSLLISILCQEGIAGEKQHVFIYFEGLEKEGHPCYGKHSRYNSHTQQGWSKWDSFLADHVRRAVLAGGTGGGDTPKHVKVDGEHHGERVERGQPCLRTGLFWE